MALVLSTEARDFLQLRRLPARLTTRQAGFRLGFNEAEIAILVKGRKLEVLNSPNSRSSYYFLATELERKAEDQLWMQEAVTFIQKKWRLKNREQAAKQDSRPQEA